MDVKKGDTVRFSQDGQWKTGIVVGIDHDNGLVNVRLHNYGQSHGADTSEESAPVLELVDLTQDNLKAFARFDINYYELMKGLPNAPVSYDKSYTLTLEDVWAALKNRREKGIDNDAFGQQWLLPLANEIAQSGAIKVIDWNDSLTDPVAAEVWQKLLDHYGCLGDAPNEDSAE